MSDTEHESNIDSEKSIVFLIAEPTVNYKGEVPNLTRLNQYGEVRTVLTIADEPSDKSKTSLEKVYESLKDFEPELDYIVWAGGNQVAAVLVGVVLRAMKIPYFNWLQFNRDINPITGRRSYNSSSYTVKKIVTAIPEMYE